MEDQTFFTKLEISEKVVNQIQGDNISTICEIQRLICRHFLSLFDCAAKRERKPRQEKKEKNTRTKGRLGQRYALRIVRCVAGTLRAEDCEVRATYPIEGIGFANDTVCRMCIAKNCELTRILHFKLALDFPYSK